MQKVFINGSYVINTSDQVLIVQNGIYLAYPKMIARLLEISVWFYEYITFNAKLYTQRGQSMVVFFINSSDKVC